MQGKYILLALVVILIAVSPTLASVNKITAGAPVFVGESNVDITRAIENCHIIAWWPEGADLSTPATKNITLFARNEISPDMSHYTFSPAEYEKFTGTWYCEEFQPPREVFEVRKPEVRIRVWDLDTGKDITGTTVPSTTNLTYRIETNLDPAMQMKYRPDRSPADLFYTVKLTNPYGIGITNIFTGSYGAPGTEILLFDSTPYITASPYYGKKLNVWNRTSKNIQGDQIYPEGTYVFTLNQNLNGMEDVYKNAGITDTAGKLTSSADVTFTFAPIITTTPTPVQPVNATSVTITPAALTPATIELTPEPTTPPVPVKTTYSPVPGWVVLAGLGIAAAFAAGQRK